jgi:hypothetical protein
MDFDQLLHDEIQDLVAEGMLDKNSPAYGIAQVVIDGRYGSLSGNQKAIYESHVMPPLTKLRQQRDIQRIRK